MKTERKNNMKKRSFVMYTAWKSYFELLEDPVLIRELLYALFDYVEGREVKIDNNKVLTAFNVMREVMEQDIALYEEKCKKNKLAAEKRWGKKTANAMQTHTDAIHMDGDNDYVNEYDNENVYEYDIDDDIDIAQPRQEIVPINVSDVINEAKKQGYDIPEEEAESFINYYFVERRGMLDGQPIRNWKNLIEGWYNHIYVDPKDVLGEGSKVFNTLPIDLQNQVFDEQEITTYKITKGTAKKIKDCFPMW